MYQYRVNEIKGKMIDLKHNAWTGFKQPCSSQARSTCAGCGSVIPQGLYSVGLLCVNVQVKKKVITEAGGKPKMKNKLMRRPNIGMD